MPGFVDCHSHPVFMESRINDFEQRIKGHSYQEISDSGGGILSTVQKVRAATQEELIQKTLPRLRAFLNHGTTTLEAKSGYGLNLESELKMLEAIEKLNRAHSAWNSSRPFSARMKFLLNIARIPAVSRGDHSFDAP